MAPALRLMLLLVPLAAIAGGCAYARNDRIAFSAGNAVRANLEGQTINPSKRSMYVTSGLGKNGPVLPTADAATPPAPAQ